MPTFCLRARLSIISYVLSSLEFAACDAFACSVPNSLGVDFVSCMPSVPLLPPLTWAPCPVSLCGCDSLSVCRSLLGLSIARPALGASLACSPLDGLWLAPPCWHDYVGLDFLDCLGPCLAFGGFSAFLCLRVRHPAPFLPDRFRRQLLLTLSSCCTVLTVPSPSPA